MQITEVQMTATVWVKMSREDLDVIWACAERHYDLKVQGLIKQGGLLYGIRNQFGEDRLIKDAYRSIRFDFSELDTMAKALEGACYLPCAVETQARGTHLHGEIHKMLRFINSQYSTRAVTYGEGYIVGREV